MSGNSAPRLEHTTLITGNVTRLVEFYRCIPGFQVKDPDENGYAEVTAGDTVFALFDAAVLQSYTNLSVPAPAAGSCVLQFAVADVPGYIAELNDALTLNPPATARDMPWGSTSAYIQDPDGNLLEFYTWG